MSSLVHCIYTSCETHPLSRADLDHLLNQSHRNNLAHGITGVLIYAGGCFMQVLEGTPESIDKLYEKIMTDPRHTNITRIIYEAIPHRYFANWTMGVSTLSPRELTEIINSGDPEAREAMLASVDEGRAKKLLRAFSEGRWRQTVIGRPSPTLLQPSAAV